MRLDPPGPAGERFRRATRECVLAVAAVQRALDDARLTPEAVAGSATALLYVTAAAYGASNRGFIEAAPPAGGPGALHFPYTAPCAVAAEVAIALGLRGPYLTLIGGPAVTIEALAAAAGLLAEQTCERALVVAVETFAECQDLFARDRRLLGRPLVEAAACVVLRPGGGGWALGEIGPAGRWEAEAAARAGETLACGPLIALALARAAGDETPTISGRWRGRRLALSPA